MNYENIKIDKNDKISIITIDRPKQLNALNKKTIKELHESIKQLREESRVIIITGSGEKSFVAGADIKEFANFSQQEGEILSETGHKMLFDFIEQSTIPIIAAINGYALGGGLELALSCHFRVCSENAKFGFPEVTLGLIPGYGGTQRITSLINKGRAIELITSAQMISSEEAKEYGLVNHIYPQKTLLESTKKIALKIANNSPLAIASAIKCVNKNPDLKKGLEAEVKEFGKCFSTKDFKEGIAAFLEKRRPKF